MYNHLRKAGVERRTNFVNSRRYNLNEAFFDQIDNAVKAYWLGFLYADGHVGIYNKQHILKVDLNQRDEAHLRQLNVDLESDYPLKFFIQSTSYGDVDVCRLHLTSSRLVSALIIHGCVQRKTSVLAPPDIDGALDRDFIRGYVDGDGSIAKSATSASGFRMKINGTQALLQWIQERLPRASNIYVSRGIHALEAHSDSVIWLYENASRALERKHERYKLIANA